MEDGLPSQICEQCVDTLVTFYKFKKTVLDNDLKLRERHQTAKTEIKKEVDETPLQNDNIRSDFVKVCSVDIPKNSTTKTKKAKKIHQCNVCGEILSCRSNFNKHVKSHTGEKPYECDICGKKFTRLEHVKVHKRIHSGTNF